DPRAIKSFRLVNQLPQPYIFHTVACCSRACLHPDARLALVCGFSASCFHDARVCAKADLYCSRAISGTLGVQVSYRLIYSSHSATPISPPVEAAVVAGVPAVAGFSVVLELLFALVSVSVFEQAINTRPNTRHNVRVI